MLLAVVRGTVVCTRKDPNIENYPIYMIEPVDEELNPVGDPLAAIDTVSSREGDLVMYIDSGEAPKVLPGKFAGIDASIVGIVDSI